MSDNVHNLTYIVYFALMREGDLVKERKLSDPDSVHTEEFEKKFQEITKDSGKDGASVATGRVPPLTTENLAGLGINS